MRKTLEKHDIFILRRYLGTTRCHDGTQTFIKRKFDTSTLKWRVAEYSTPLLCPKYGKTSNTLFLRSANLAVFQKCEIILLPFQKCSIFVSSETFVCQFWHVLIMIHFSTALPTKSLPFYLVRSLDSPQQINKELQYCPAPVVLSVEIWLPFFLFFLFFFSAVFVL